MGLIYPKPHKEGTMDVKPCPMCGHEAKIHEKEEDSMNVYFVRCTNCGHKGYPGSSAEQAVERWRDEG